MEFRNGSTDLDTLEALPRTLLISLAARAHGPKIFPALNPDDRYAEALLNTAGWLPPLCPVMPPFCSMCCGARN